MSFAFGGHLSSADASSMGCSSTKVVVHDPQEEIEFFDKYELSDVLGKGAYGTVHRAHCVGVNEELAVKIVDLNSGRKNPRQLRKDARSEEKAWARIGAHPNVVGLRESFIDGSFAYFVMELCTGSLVAAWEAEPDLNEYTYARYFKEMAQALAQIHSVGVIHRDVKHDNFIVGAPDGRTVKLCDFGLSAVMVGDGKHTGQIGTPPYMAPEMVAERGTHGPPADVWSFGVIVYTAFFGCWPYKPTKYTAEEMTKAIREGKAPPSFAARRGLRNVVSGAGIRFVQVITVAGCSFINSYRIESFTRQSWTAMRKSQTDAEAGQSELQRQQATTDAIKSVFRVLFDVVLHMGDTFTMAVENCSFRGVHGRILVMVLEKRFLQL